MVTFNIKIAKTKENLMESNESKLLEIAKKAYNSRTKLIQKFKNQNKKGNVVINLPYGCKYLYGETIKNPIIDFGQGNSIKDMDFFAKYIWNNSNK